MGKYYIKQKISFPVVVPDGSMEYDYYKSSVYAASKAGSAHIATQSNKLRGDLNDKSKNRKVYGRNIRAERRGRNTALVFAFAIVFTTVSAVLAGAAIWYRNIAASEKKLRFSHDDNSKKSALLDFALYVAELKNGLLSLGGVGDGAVELSSDDGTSNFVYTATKTLAAARCAEAALYRLGISDAGPAYAAADGIAVYLRDCAAAILSACSSYNAGAVSLGGDNFTALARYAEILSSTLDKAVSDFMRDESGVSDVSSKDKHQSANEVVGSLYAEFADYRALNIVEGSDKNSGIETYSLLREYPEVSEEEARRIASKLIGGGATLSLAVNHTFPLVYTFYCENACADVTRMGGFLIRMTVYRDGNLSYRSEGECRAAAEKFLKRAKISGLSVLRCEKINDDNEYLYVFTVPGKSEDDGAVYITVSTSGARVSRFDATEYYKFAMP